MIKSTSTRVDVENTMPTSHFEGLIDTEIRYENTRPGEPHQPRRAERDHALRRHRQARSLEGVPASAPFYRRTSVALRGTHDATPVRILTTDRARELGRRH